MRRKKKTQPTLSWEQLERRFCPAAVSIAGGREVTEGDTSPVVFTVTLSEPLASPASVSYSLAGSTARLNSDFRMTPRAAGGRITFAPGETSKQITVSVTDDAARESTEWLRVSLQRPQNCVLGNAVSSAIIRDNDSYTATVTPVSGTVTEGSPASFTLGLSSPATKDERFTVSVANGSAKAGSDFARLRPFGVVIPRGAASTTFSVATLSDATAESAESFHVSVKPSTRGMPTPGRATVLIEDTVPPPPPIIPSIQVADASVSEGNSGSATARFLVTLSAPTTAVVAVNYRTSNGTAVSGSDYSAASGTLTFTPGETSKNIVVTVLGDSTAEPAETFTLNLSSPVNATVAKTSATGTILNDDAAAIPGISIANTSLLEGNSGTTAALFTLTLSFASSSSVTVNYGTGNDTATASDSDYVSASGTVTFAPGELQKVITVAVTGDTKPENDESFSVSLFSPLNATLLRSQAIGTIRNDDAAPAVGSWTIMVYMTGDNLNPYAHDDINEMERALGQLPSSVNIVVSWDQPTASPGNSAATYSTANGTQRAWNTYGRAKLIPDRNNYGNTGFESVLSTFEIYPGDKNTGDPTTLIDFLRWGAQQAPANRYLLMMWGHGGGLLGSNWDKESGNDEITITEMASVLATPGVPTFDIVGYDNCVMGMTEIAYALSPYVPGFFVGSQEDVRGYGHDYTTAFSSLAANPGGVSSETVARGVVQSFQNQKTARLDVLSTYSAIRSSALPSLATSLRNFVTSTQSFSTFDWNIIRIWVQPVHTYGGKTFADLGQFLGYIANQASLPVLTKYYAAQARDALDAAVVLRTSDAWNSSGLSIYLRADGIFDYRYDSDAPQFISATGWADFIYWLNS